MMNAKPIGEWAAQAMTERGRFGQWAFVDEHYWVLYDHFGNEFYYCDLRERTGAAWLAHVAKKHRQDTVWNAETLGYLVAGMASRGDL